MPKFQKMTVKLGPRSAAPNTPKDDARQALAQAIHERDKAIKAVDDARTAERLAREKSFDARRVADQLRDKTIAPIDHDEILLAVAGGEVDDVLALARTDDAARREIELADERARAWKTAADHAEAAIEARQRAADEAEKILRERAASALEQSLDLPRMLAEAREAADWLVARRSVFLFLMETLPRKSEDRAALAEFMARPWLEAELSNGWMRHPALLSYRAALEALAADAGAVINIAP